ncbi:hypothetical protein PspLS_00063 [Pyricularia sp. CBS 133598]|nr:hypothetical protein PspLS_00063 [Pyricularia sp. CBS 133598]
MTFSCHKQTLARTCKGPTKVRQPRRPAGMAEPEDFADQSPRRNIRDAMSP